MSRSVKKRPITGWGHAASEKKDKQLFNRRVRKHVRQRLHMGLDINFREHPRSGRALFSKDGKQYCHGYVIRK